MSAVDAMVLNTVAGLAILPCPFCGTRAEVERRQMGWEIACRGCGLPYSEAPHLADAAAVWNRRTPPPLAGDTNDATDARRMIERDLTGMSTILRGREARFQYLRGWFARYFVAVGWPAPGGDLTDGPIPLTPAAEDFDR